MELFKNDQTTPFSSYLNHQLQLNHLTPNQLSTNTHINLATIHKWLKNHHPKDTHLIALSHIFKRPVAELYWYRLTPDDRQHVSPKASLTVISEIIQKSITQNITATDLKDRLKIDNQHYANWRKLRMPIDEHHLKHIAHILRIPFQTLNQYQHKDEQQTVTATPVPQNPFIPNHPQTTPQPKATHDSILIQNLKRRIPFTTYKNLSQLLTQSQMNYALANQNHQDLKYAHRISAYLDMNLQYLLTEAGQTDSQNHLYDTVKHYSNLKHMTFNEFAKKCQLPFGWIERSPKSKYLNGLINISQLIHVTIDDLITPFQPYHNHLANTQPKINVTPHQIPQVQTQTLSIQLAQPSQPQPIKIDQQFKALTSQQQQLILNIIHVWQQQD